MPFAAVEFPVYAILLGLLGNLVLTRVGVRDRLAGGFRTEFFIKTGLVLLGASINFAVIVSAARAATTATPARAGVARVDVSVAVRSVLITAPASREAGP